MVANLLLAVALTWSATAAPHWTVYSIPGATPNYGGAAASPDGRSVWFSMYDALARVDVNGDVQVIPVPLDPAALAFGADGRIYTPVCCTSSGYYAVMAVTTSGVVSLYVPPSGDGINDGVALGPDGNIWISEFTHVAKVSPSGVITEYPIPLPPYNNSNNELGIIAGPQGTVVFPIVDEYIGHPDGYLAAIDTKSGAIREIPVPCSYGYPLVLGADGDVYESCPDASSPKVGILRVAPTGHEQLYPDTYGVDTDSPQSFAATPDGLIWAITFTSDTDPNELSVLDPHSGRIVRILAPSALGPLSALAVGPSHHIWAQGGEQAAVGIFYP